MTSCVCLALSGDRSYGLADDSPDQHLVLLVCNLHSVTQVHLRFSEQLVNFGRHCRLPKGFCHVLKFTSTPSV